jgi:uncharacterized membrane protein
MSSHYIYAFIFSLVVMTVLDATWLGFIAPAFYRKHIGFIMAKKPNWLAAILFYLIFVFGVTVFVVYPGWHHDYSIITNILRGCLFGFVTYATYDLTNQATLKKWPYIVTVVDLLWGTILTGAVSVVSIALLKAFIK